MHRARSGTLYYYIYRWSLWQGDEDSYRLITPDEAREFLSQVVGETGPASMNEREIALAEEYFPGIFDETA